MSSFQNLSIRLKLLVMLFLVAAISLLLGFAVHVAQDVFIFKKDVAEGASAMARVIGDYCVVDLAFEDHEAARQTLAKVVPDQNVEGACLYDYRGVLFASFTRTGAPSCSAVAQSAQVLFEGDRIIVSEPIFHDRQNYGRICLYLSASPLHATIRSYFLTLLALTAGLLLVSLVLSLSLQNVISKPILKLADMARSISKSKDYSLRVTGKVSKDEIGMLSDEFNSLLDQVEHGKAEQDLIEAALRESEKRYRNLVEFSPQAIYLEQEGRILYANPSGLRLYGCGTLAELDGKSLRDLFPALEATVRKRDSGPVEHTLIRRDGKSVSVEASFIVTVHDGRTALQALAWDITESKNMRQAAERMQRLASLGEFSAILAHEIRNSLGAIALNMKTLSERLVIPPENSKTFANMELGMQRIQDTIKGMLDFARPAPPSLRKVNLHRLLDNSIHTLEGELDEASIRVIREYDSADPEVLVDPGQMAQVFVNLLLNARHAMVPGGTITVSTLTVDSNVEVRIADTGKGIAPENLERIFDPFFTTSSTGAGLGLAFVARILEQHHAPILVNSKLNEGTVFTIRFATPEVP